VTKTDENIKDFYVNTEQSQTLQQPTKLPVIQGKKKKQMVEVNKVKFNKYFGDRYNPYNYEIHKEKINTCSIKDSFRYKK
jgi:hypothetical protein